MRKIPLPAQETLREYFDYDGVHLTWKKLSPGCRRAKIGDVVGGVQSTGRKKMVFMGKQYKVHRVIWKWLYGTEPDEIDHIDINDGNNRRENLRDVTHAINHRNRTNTKYPDLPPGVTSAGPGRYRGQVWLNGKCRSIRTCDTPEEVHQLWKWYKAHGWEGNEHRPGTSRPTFAPVHPSITEFCCEGC